MILKKIVRQFNQEYNLLTRLENCRSFVINGSQHYGINVKISLTIIKEAAAAAKKA